MESQKKNTQNIDPDAIINSILNQIQDQLQIEQLGDIKLRLIEGRIFKAKELLNTHLGTKKFKKIIPLVSKLKQKNREPIKESEYICTKNGIKLHLLETKKNLKDYNPNQISVALTVGMTGVGKTTYLNSLVNYLLEVDPYDDFRYLLVDDTKSEQKNSVTSQITTYIIQKRGKMKKHVALIDVPGLGDTKGIRVDKEIILKISRAMKQNIPYLNQILYIFKATDARLTPSAAYVINQVMSIFAKDMCEIFQFILTFSDYKQPIALPSLKSQFGSIIKQMNKQQWYLKVDNSAIFQQISVDNQMGVRSFYLGIESLSKTVQQLYLSKFISTQKTLQVMKTREQVQNCILKIHERVDNALAKQDQIRQTSKAIQAVSQEMLMTKDFSVTTNVSQSYKQPSNYSTTTCLNCKFTCHQNCRYSNNAQKLFCCAMSGQNCTVCTKKCHWTSHSNLPYLIKFRTVLKTTTNQELMMKFNISSNSKHSKQEIIAKLITEYVELQQENQISIKDLMHFNDLLREIQLAPKRSLKVIEYLDEIIQSQLLMKKQGYLQRVNELKIMQNMEIKKQQISKIKNPTQLRKQRIDGLIPDKQIQRTIFSKVSSKLCEFFGIKQKIKNQ